MYRKEKSCGKLWEFRGTLKPVKLPVGDRFYVKDLMAAYLESKQNGRI
ncbi:hypothetical protein QFZ20_000650 [Flavobacterium sp. W4I14]|nr:hypothetical protein [Flavobacterium sp. W4I14]